MFGNSSCKPAALVLLLLALLHTKSALASHYPECYEEWKSSGGKLEVHLDVIMSTSLNGTRKSPLYNGCPLGPTLRAKPGDFVTVHLNNLLPPGSDTDHQLYDYIQNELSDPINVTIIINRLDSIGNAGNPAFGYWGQKYMNLHFHGAEVSPSIEMLEEAIDGGVNKTYTFQIPPDKAPGLFWYHNHFHGTTSYSMLSGLYGFLVVEDDSPYTILNIPELKNANVEEQFLMLGEFIGGTDGTPVDIFPFVLTFDWISVTNGMDGANYQLDYEQGDVVLFRANSATAEPTIILHLQDHNAMILSMDGFMLPEPVVTDKVILTGGQRIEFVIKFDTPGTFTWHRMPWDAGIVGIEACNATFGTPVEHCVSYDVQKVIGTVTVTAKSVVPNPILPTLPGVPKYYQELAMVKPVTSRVINFQMATGLPLFQIPYNGPPGAFGLGFGINDRFYTPHYYHGEITAGTCETWTIVSTPPAEHSFHTHASAFLVTHLDGVPVPKPYWEDSHRVLGNNVTVHACFERLKGGDIAMIHCHQVAHQDTGMVAAFKVVAAPTKAPTQAPTMAPILAPTQAPTSAPAPSCLNENAACVFSNSQNVCCTDKKKLVCRKVGKKFSCLKCLAKNARCKKTAPKDCCNKKCISRKINGKTVNVCK